jgi:D-alanine transaminase
MTRTAWIDGAFVPLAEAKVSVEDRGFLFADGVYEVTAVLDGRLVDSAAHMARLERSAAALNLALPVAPAEIEEIERALIARNRLDQGTVYLQLTRGAGDRDFLGDPEQSTLVLFTQAKTLDPNPLAERGIEVATVTDLRWARRDIKSVMLLAQVFAKRQAAAKGAYEAWLVDDDGFVTEGASSTALIVTAEGTLVTRPNSRTILPGCTRAAVERLAKEDGVRVEERAFTVAEALAAREAMMTSASTFVLPIVAIDGQMIGDGGPGPITRRLRELYLKAARAK